MAPKTTAPSLHFDPELAKSCSRAFSIATGLGCTVSDAHGLTLYEHGYGCASCELCGIGGLPHENCIYAHNYGMTAAERFGGRYIYFCPMGLTCFVSPIIGDTASAAKITVGPFIMVEKEDFIDCEIQEHFGDSPEALKQAVAFLDKIPVVLPEKVQELSVLLFMAAGFMNNLSDENRFLSMARSDSLQKQISTYIQQMKQQAAPLHYPFEKEKTLIQSISHYDKEGSLQYLKEFLAALLLNSGGNLEWMKSRIYEFLVLLSRTAIDGGAQESDAMRPLANYQKAAGTLKSFDTLSAWLVKLLENFMDGFLRYSDTRHGNLINRCIQYMDAHYSQPLSLEQTASAIGLSPAYLSRIFRKETGITFNHYLNQLRITKAKDLLRHTNMRLLDIALLTGFEDQSYFTKVFRRTAGLSPSDYRKLRQGKTSNQEEHN